MKIIEMRPELTPWKQGQHRKVSSWKFRDEGLTDFTVIRYIWHYGTLMGYYAGKPICLLCAMDQHHSQHECPRTDLSPGSNRVWRFHPLSLGHGGVSDQNGMNQLFGYRYLWWHESRTFTTDYRHAYHRDVKGGGPRIINLDTMEQVQ